MTCKHCGKNNPNDATVCKYCGEELTPAAKTAQPRPKTSRADAQSASIQTLRQLSLILAAAALVALILGLAGLLKGCSADKAAETAQKAADEAKTAAAAVQTTADQTSDALSQALSRIEELETAQTPSAPVTNPEPDDDQEPTTEVSRRFPATDPTTTVNVTVGEDGKVTALAYADASGSSVAVEIGAAGLPISYVLNNSDELVTYESDIDLCAAIVANVSEGYAAQVSYRWESLTGEEWTPRPDKVEQCLTVSPGYWFSTRAQYRCEITIEVFDDSESFDSTGAACDEVKVYTQAVTYTDWEAYAEANVETHDVFLQWSDMMKTYE